MELAPIVLFVYNRPKHTRRTLEALSQNHLANQSLLYVFADGPKANASSCDLIKINEVRELICKQDFCKEVIISEAQENLGLAKSVISGVTQVVNIHGKVIVLEDDIITSNYFLEYMNSALTTYCSEFSVFGITGHKFRGISKKGNQTYFLKISNSWGYATWKDRWDSVIFDSEILLEKVEKKKLQNQMKFADVDFYKMLKNQIDSKIDSWSIRFFTSMILHNGVFLYPKIPLSLNIGFDGSGVHCPENKITMKEKLSKNNRVEVQRLSVFENLVLTDKSTYLLSSKKTTFPFSSRITNSTKIKIIKELLVNLFN